MAINGSQLYVITKDQNVEIDKNKAGIAKNKDDIAAINTKLGDINTNVTKLEERAWTISDGTNNSPIKDEKVTFKR